MTWTLVFLLIVSNNFPAVSQAVVPGFSSLAECKAAGDQLKKEFPEKGVRSSDYTKAYSCIQQTEKPFWRR